MIKKHLLSIIKLYFVSWDPKKYFIFFFRLAQILSISSPFNSSELLIKIILVT